jgi:hypothetical protein
MTTCFHLHGTPDIWTPELLALVPQPPSVMRIEPITNPEGFVVRILVTFKGSMDEGLSGTLERSGYHQEKPPEPEEEEIEKDGS